jgi:hypothetical protein
VPFEILEWFGQVQNAELDVASSAPIDELCPFINKTCTKKFRDSSISGVCSVLTRVESGPVIICPNRLYGENYAVLGNVANLAFGQGHRVIHPDEFRTASHDGTSVVAFGHHFGKELRLHGHGARGNDFVDWILARISSSGDLKDFVAVEVQTIDTTGTYYPEVMKLRKGSDTVGQSKAGLNWRNVIKRILPQIIYKGHVLRREPLCSKGLFFICPSAVYGRIIENLGNNLLPYDNLQPGSITFMWYALSGPENGAFGLRHEGKFSTTVDQIALAFTSPANLPPQGVYEEAINAALGQL